MDQNAQQVRLNQLLQQLKTDPQTAELVYQDYQELWASLDFSRIQVALWLASLQMDVGEDLGEKANTTVDSSYLIALLQATGGRLPIAQVLKKLPMGVVTSEQHIRKLAQQHDQLQVKGPFLVLDN